MTWPPGSRTTRPAMPPPARAFTGGVVLAAGGSRRLGQPKQLLPYRDSTLLGHALATARACGVMRDAGLLKTNPGGRSTSAA